MTDSLDNDRLRQNNPPQPRVGWHYVQIFIKDREWIDTQFFVECDKEEDAPIGQFFQQSITGEAWAVEAFPAIPQCGNTLYVQGYALAVSGVSMFGASYDELEFSRIVAHIDCEPPPRAVARKPRGQRFNGLYLVPKPEPEQPPPPITD